MKVLLVEDDILDAEMVELILKREAAGFVEISRAETLDGALELLDAERFDIVLVDLNLPDASGSESVSRITLARNGLPVVVISGNDDAEFAIDLIRAGAQDFLVKGSSGFGQIYRSMRYAIERKSAELRLKHLASFDSLTGLANRQELYFQVEKAFAHADRNGDLVAMLLFDLDKFKLVNDLHGHDAGDKLLVEISNRLQASIRKGDTAARLGGDEFAVVLEGIQTADAALEWARGALNRLNEPIRFEGTTLPVSASVGGAVYPTDGDSVESVMRNADLAMYKVKQAGRNAVDFYDESMNRNLVRQQQLETELRDALENGDIVAYFQPKIALDSGAVTGFEALSRWLRADGSIISPAEFLPIARSLRLLPAVGATMRQAAIQLVQSWQNSGRKAVPVSINVDPVELAIEGFSDRVISEVSASGLDCQNIRIEITETAFLEKTEVSIANLAALQSFGIGIELDDFGAGHSSLTYLRHFPIDTIKLDRSLIASIGDDEFSTRILKAIVNLAGELGMTIVAEGIETAIQVRSLVEMGVEFGQGFLIARPMPASATSEWLDNQGTRLGPRLGNMTGTFAALDEFAILEQMRGR